MNVLHVIDGELVEQLPHQWRRRLASALAYRLAKEASRAATQRDSHVTTSSGGEEVRDGK